MWRIVSRRDDDTVGKPGFASAIVRENRVGKGKRRGIFVQFRDHDLHPVGRQYFKRTRQRQHGECVSVHAKKQWAINPVLPSVKANRLTAGKDMPLIEGLFK